MQRNDGYPTANLLGFVPSKPRQNHWYVFIKTNYYKYPSKIYFRRKVLKSGVTMFFIAERQ